MNRLCAVLLVALIGVSGAWAQSPFKTLETEGGCKLLQLTNIAQPPFRWSGQCEAGLASAVGIYTTNSTNAEGVVSRFHGKDFRVRGILHGAMWNIVDANIRASNFDYSLRLAVGDDGRVSGMVVLPPDTSLESALTAANGVLQQVSVKNLPSVSREEYLGDIRRWQKSPAEFAQVVSRGGDIQRIQLDDPKARGRSARGG